jgi:hypothetical protein
MPEKNKSSISNASTYEEMGEFWDTHDFTDFDTDAADVVFDIACAVPIESELLGSIEQQAKKRGVKVETLVNLWLQQKLNENRFSPVNNGCEEYAGKNDLDVANPS